MVGFLFQHLYRGQLLVAALADEAKDGRAFGKLAVPALILRRSLAWPRMSSASRRSMMDTPRSNHQKRRVLFQRISAPAVERSAAHPAQALMAQQVLGAFSISAEALRVKVQGRISAGETPDSTSRARR